MPVNTSISFSNKFLIKISLPFQHKKKKLEPVEVG